jgi:hypothetical protein
MHPHPPLLLMWAKPQPAKPAKQRLQNIRNGGDLLALGGRWEGWGMKENQCQGRTMHSLLYLQTTVHYKDEIPKFRNKYSQKRNIGVSVPISTLMRLCVIYIFPRLVCLFCWRKYVDQSWDYKNRSQTHECENWG